MTNPLWKPSPQRIQDANLTHFIKFVQETFDESITDFSKLRDWSTTHIADFWSAVAKFCQVKFSKETSDVLQNESTPESARFFEGATLNYAEHLLYRKRDDEDDAIVFWGEDVIKRRLSFKDLYDQVSKVAQYFKELGVKPKDRIAGFVPNTPEAIVCMLAATSLGAIWTSCSPDFGVSAVIDRFGQIEPSILIAADRYIYRGKEHGCSCKIKDIQSRLPSLKSTIVFSYDGGDIAPIPNTMSYQEILTTYKAEEISFTQVKFNDPLFIMYSSGTTGVPKCIVHGVGGTLLQHLKEHQLHSDIKPKDRIFYFSTCGWMMWNWQVTALASGATLIIYDGSPVHPSEHILFDLIEQERITFFGTAAKVIDEWKKRKLCPKESHDLSSLRDIASTGSPLVPESFDYVYQNIKEDMGLMSISGGTDIISCFVLGNPIAPVWRGEIQTAGLGMAVEIFNDEGQSVQEEKGELVCTKPFPSMPISFWDDLDGKKYHKAYFNRYNNIWCHGDFAEKTANDGFIIYGRSDTVLNPGGVRIGTAEIYRQVEKIDVILESVVVGQNTGDDVRVVLFVKLREGSTLTEDLKNQIKIGIRQNATPRHVPSVILAVPDIPRTKSGKLVELAVKNIIEGHPVKNKDALANPEALQYFENINELKLD